MYRFCSYVAALVAVLALGVASATQAAASQAPLAWLTLNRTTVTLRVEKEHSATLRFRLQPMLQRALGWKGPTPTPLRISAESQSHTIEGFYVRGRQVCSNEDSILNRVGGRPAVTTTRDFFFRFRPGRAKRVKSQDVV